jgi:8-oxo-dGTP pyrophosphatase MutT (NUDIX family)
MDTKTDVAVSGADPAADTASSDLVRDAIIAALQHFSPRLLDGDGLRPATVAIVVQRRGEEFGIWVIERAQGLRRDPGQYALPGGRSEQGEDVIAAGLRELSEETGIVLQRHDVLGRLDDYVTRTGYLMSTIVCWSDGYAPVQPNPEEVAHAYFVPLPDLLVTPRFPTDPETARRLIEFPLLGVVIHAATGAVLYQFAEVVLRGRATRVDTILEPRVAP